MNNLLKKTFLAAIVVLIVLVQYFEYSKIFLSIDLIGNVIVFLSIVFGFGATSLAIFSTSSYMGTLYSIPDRENPSQTLLHSLLQKYRMGLSIALVSIFYLVILQASIQGVGGSVISLAHPYALSFGAMLMLNFYFGFNLMWILTQIVTQEGKRMSR